MAQQNINTGTLPNDKTGDSLRTAMIKVQNNFSELYTTAPVSNSVNIGNTTSNVTANSTAVFIGNSGTYTLANSSSITSFSGYYGQILNSGANNLLVGTTNATSIVFSTNSTQKAVISANGNIGIGDAAPSELLTVGGTISANQISVAGAFTINSTFVSTLVANNTNFVGTITAANVVSNAQLQANLASYITNTGFSANVASLTANNTTFVGSVTAANVVSNAQLQANLASYQTSAGLSANVGSILTSYTGNVAAANYNTGSGYGTVTGGFLANVTTIAVGNSSTNVVITSNTVSVYGSNVGYMEIPQNSQSAAYTTVLSDSGKHIIHPSSDNNARTFTIANNSSVAYPLGTVLTFVNMANTLTIAINNDTMYLAGNTSGATGSRTLAVYGIASVVKVASTTWMISGSSLT